MADAAGGGRVEARTLDTLNTVFACRSCTALRCRGGRCGGPAVARTLPVARTLGALNTVFACRCCTALRCRGARCGRPAVARTLGALNTVFATRCCTALRCRSGRCGRPAVARTLGALNTVFAGRCCTALKCRSGRFGWKRPRRSSHPGYPQYCDCLQVLHRSEVQEWQVRLEEAQEKARTLDTLNNGLRHERDSFRKVSFPGIKILLF